MSLIINDWGDIEKFAQDLSIAGNVSTCEAESDYLRLWQQNVASNKSTDLLAMAVAGGLLADRMAWVFVAGYQSAIRRTFPNETFGGWGAFAVSEDRKGHPPLAGVSLQRSATGGLVSGHKTWVACSESIEHLVIKVGAGKTAGYYHIPRNSGGLVIANKNPPAKSNSFLAEMSQGVAHMKDVLVKSQLDQSEVAHFGIRESLYIYAAFCAFAGQYFSELLTVDDCANLIDRLAKLVENLPSDQASLDELKAVDLGVQSLLQQISPFVEAPNWAKDSRLIAMYSPGIQNREAV